MATAELINPNPVVYQRKDGAPRKVRKLDVLWVRPARHGL